MKATHLALQSQTSKQNPFVSTYVDSQNAYLPKANISIVVTQNGRRPNDS
jgi:hypothetical protein